MIFFFLENHHHGYLMGSQSFSNKVSKNCNSVMIIVHEKKDIHIAKKRNSQQYKLGSRNRGCPTLPSVTPCPKKCLDTHPRHPPKPQHPSPPQLPNQLLLEGHQKTKLTFQQQPKAGETKTGVLNKIIPKSKQTSKNQISHAVDDFPIFLLV